MLDIWQAPVIVPFSAVDRSNDMKLSAAFDFFQEAANQHAEGLGVGRKAMESASQVWILSRMSVVMDRRPCWNERLTMRTWPRGTQKLFAVRDYEFLDAEGKLAVRGRSGWIIFDTEKKRPLRPETIVNALPLNEGRNALPDGAGSVPGIDNEGGALRLGERTALYSDIDMNGHVNNARYIAWIEDALDPELFYKAPQLRLDINYISEVLPGETLELWTAPGQNASTLIEGRKGQCAFRAELRTRFDGAA